MIRLAGFVVASFLAAVAAWGEESALRNGDFADWQGPLPTAWSLEIGAMKGQGKESIVDRAEGGGLRLSGDAATCVWRMATQACPASAGIVYRLGFRARAVDLRAQPGGHENAYVGVQFQDASGNRLALRVVDVRARDWASDLMIARAPLGTRTATVTVFLSKMGSMEVRDVSFRACEPRESFALLAEALTRHYSYFAHRGIDPQALVERHRPRIEAAGDVPQFIAAAREMLAELRDLHVFLVDPEGRQVATWTDAVQDNFNYRAVSSVLKDVRQFGKVGFIGRTAEGFACLAIGTLGGEDAPYREIEAALAGLLDAPGFLLDLRANGGGDEVRAQRIASFFTDTTRVYARSRFRSGPGAGDLVDGPERRIGPRSEGSFTRPIVCLIGPRCMSSGEGFAKMMRALPHVTLVGRATRGSSGNPAPVDLPNGVSVWFSRWVDLLPDGTSPEGIGIRPDVEVAHEGAGDPTFQAALEELRKRTR